MSRNRNWVFTWNNYTEDEEEHVQEIDCKYLVYGREVGEKGTRHLQGFIALKNTFLKAKDGIIAFWKAFPGLGRAHFEGSMGTNMDNQR